MAVAAVGRSQRGGAAGAFSRPGGAPKWPQSKRAKRAEYENMQAPVVGGVRLPHGNGETIRLARGASLSDFAEKISANPASLVQALFNLGEMVTATQSVVTRPWNCSAADELRRAGGLAGDEDRELLESFDLSYGEDSGDEGDLGSDLPSSPSWTTSTTARPDCWTPSGRPASARRGPAASPSTLVAYQVVVEHDGVDATDHPSSTRRVTGVHRHACPRRQGHRHRDPGGRGR